ncbi:methyltransferase family protein [Leeuwenhoekiella palythoae]|uniref:methyltransferase family protein n=1 Tax=Leeuwenhoekiella palythoae TaxID=573501 RepID=UPI003514BC2F
MKKAYNILLVTLQIIIMCAFFFPISLLKFRLPEAFNFGAYTLFVLGVLCVLIALYQLRHQLSPFPSPRKNSKLINSGIFRYSRHPIYFGILLSYLSLSILFVDVYKLVLTAVLYLFFCWKSTFEENLLVARFPKYKIYRKKTPRF